MKKLLSALILLSNTALADDLPVGCYVAYSDITRCWSPVDSRIKITLPPTDQEGYDKFGALYFSLINLAQDSLKLNMCNADIQTLTDDYNSLINVNVALQTHADEQALASARLVKKLRRACGAKCRKIK